VASLFVGDHHERTAFLAAAAGFCAAMGRGRDLDAHLGRPVQPQIVIMDTETAGR
jgi:hypothetical protein